MPSQQWWLYQRQSVKVWHTHSLQSHLHQLARGKSLQTCENRTKIKLKKTAQPPPPPPPMSDSRMQLTCATAWHKWHMIQQYSTLQLCPSCTHAHAHTHTHIHTHTHKTPPHRAHTSTQAYTHTHTHIHTHAHKHTHKTPPHRAHTSTQAYTHYTHTHTHTHTSESQLFQHQTLAHLRLAMRELLRPMPMHFSRCGAKREAARWRWQLGHTHSKFFLVGAWPSTSTPGLSTRAGDVQHTSSQSTTTWDLCARESP